MNDKNMFSGYNDFLWRIFFMVRIFFFFECRNFLSGLVDV